MDVIRIEDEHKINAFLPKRINIVDPCRTRASKTIIVSMMV